MDILLTIGTWLLGALQIGVGVAIALILFRLFDEYVL